jgi:hypothetical protein
MYKLLYYNCVSFIKAEDAYPTGAPDPAPVFGAYYLLVYVMCPFLQFLVLYVVLVHVILVLSLSLDFYYLYNGGIPCFLVNDSTCFVRVSLF